MNRAPIMKRLISALGTTRNYSVENIKEQRPLGSYKVILTFYGEMDSKLHKPVATSTYLS